MMRLPAAFKRMKFHAVICLKDLGVKPMADALSAFRDGSGRGHDLVFRSRHRDRWCQLSGPRELAAHKLEPAQCSASAL